MDGQVLTTKLYAPPLRPGLVDRPRLLHKLNQGYAKGSRVTIITAPAGYGKTTLALEWLESLGQPYGWLSLDRADNYPLQLYRYLAAALAQINEPLRQAVQAAGEVPFEPDNPAWLQNRLAALINLLAAVRQPFLLALDDYHALSDLAIHEAVGFLLERLPAAMHVLIITRQDPLLPLSRLRSRGLLTEVRLGELRFTADEALSFLNGTMGLGLAPEQAAALEGRTEGWIAGLQLAAISLAEGAQSAGQRADLIQAFAGDERHIVD